MSLTPDIVSERREVGLIRAIGLIFKKDILIEWRSKSRLTGMSCYAITLLMLFAFAVGPDPVMLQKHASAYVWMSVVTVSTLLLSQSFQNELESDALEGLLLVPVPPAAIYYGKALSNFVWILLLEIISLPFAVLLFQLDLTSEPLMFTAVFLLGAGGVAAPGTLYAGLTGRLAAQQLMLPVLLFPLLIPTVLSAVKATNLIITHDPFDQISAWFAVMCAFNAIYWTLCGVMFSKVVDE